MDTAEGPAQESGAASWRIRSLREPTDFRVARSLLLPFQRIILRAYTFHPHRSQALHARQPSSSARRRTETRTIGSRQVRDQFCGYENGTSQLIG
jgi:hypothetical protein